MVIRNTKIGICANPTIAIFHAKNGFGLEADGVFFSKDDSMLRYALQVLMLCAIGIAALVLGMGTTREMNRKSNTPMPRKPSTLASYQPGGCPPEAVSHGRFIAATALRHTAVRLYSVPPVIPPAWSTEMFAPSP